MALNQVTTRAALASLTHASGDCAILTESGRDGLFIFDGSDLSGEVALDPEQGVFIPPSGTTGSSGAWRRPYEHITVTDYMFGATDGSDNADQIEAWSKVVWNIPCGAGAMLSRGKTDRTIEAGAESGSDSSATRALIFAGQIKATAAMDAIIRLSNIKRCSLQFALELWGADTTNVTLALTSRLAKNGFTYANSSHCSATGTVACYDLINYGFVSETVDLPLNHFAEVPYIIAVSCGSSPRAGVDYVQSATWTTRSFSQNGTTNLTNMHVSFSDTSSMRPGYGITGTGIPSNTAIDTVDNATQVTLTKQPTVAGTNTFLVQSRSGDNNSTNQKTVLDISPGSIPPTDPQGIPQIAKINGFYYRIEKAIGTLVTLSAPWLDNATSITNGGGNVEFVYGGAAATIGGNSSALRLRGVSSQLCGFVLFDSAAYGAICAHLYAGSNDSEIWYAFGNNNASLHFGGRVVGGYSENAPVVVSMGNSASSGTMLPQTAGTPMDVTKFYRLVPRISMTSDTMIGLSMTELAQVDGFAGKLIVAQTGTGSSTTWDPPSVAAGGRQTTTVTLPAYIAYLSTAVRATFTQSLQGMILFASITSSNFTTGQTTVTVTLFNPTGAAIDLASGTLTVALLR